MKRYRIIPALSVIAVLACMGIGLIGLSRGATFTAGQEAEAGLLAGNSGPGDSSGASKGASVKFGVANSGAGCQPVPKTGGGSWQCSFSDEFTGSALSGTWSRMPYDLGDSCTVNDGGHVKVSDGVLQLIATKGGSGCSWTTGGIQSQGKFAQHYGRFEIRAKLPADNLSWPAFWMMPDGGNTGEIDIFEMLGGDNEVVNGTLLPGNKHGSFSLHTPAGGPGPTTRYAVTPDTSSEYHTYTLEWTASGMDVLVDGKQAAHFSGYGENGAATMPFPAVYGSEPFHMLINLAMQKYEPSWGITPPSASTIVMYVDYVRAWK